jgi:hypothetical protein
MSRIPSRKLIWCLKLYIRNKNLWDRACEDCHHQTPVFVYEHHNKQEHTHFGSV